MLIVETEMQCDTGRGINSIMESNKKYPCPICGAMCMSEPKGSFDICPVCGWEDDYVGRDYPNDPGMNGDWSINQAKKAWASGETIKKNYPNPNKK
ncbi:CPCC family cysteine-rich protein [Oscillibacter ruminantium]|jgi:predicted RNA-binding Zn-ribbon protein involved in translation (DUF1610 family)|uniref:CPCC family cysteine-rich protein n=1 Tax=Oscillibacter ruminantium TaxID=1263547 RepID=UPI0034E2650A